MPPSQGAIAPPLHVGPGLCWEDTAICRTPTETQARGFGYQPTRAFPVMHWHGLLDLRCLWVPTAPACGWRWQAGVLVISRCPPPPMPGENQDVTSWKTFLQSSADAHCLGLLPPPPNKSIWLGSPGKMSCLPWLRCPFRLTMSPSEPLVPLQMSPTLARATSGRSRHSDPSGVSLQGESLHGHHS